MNEEQPTEFSGEVSRRLNALSPTKQALLRLRAKQANAKAVDQWKIVPQPGRDSAPLSFSQQQLWLVNQLLRDRSIINVPRALRFSGNLDLPALQRTLEALVERHEILRTIYTAPGGKPVQVVTENRCGRIQVHDLRELPEAEQTKSADRIMAADLNRPFELDRDVILRATLLILGEQEHILFLVTHHICSDGWSRGVLLRELAALYNDFHASRQSSLPPLPIQYADFAAWQRSYFQDQDLEQALAFWKKQMAGAPPLLELATDRPRPAEQTFHAMMVTMPAELQLLDRLRALSKQEGATLFMTCLAALKVLLANYCHQEDIVVGTPVSGRKQVETEPLIGYFANLLALRTDLSGDPTFRELIRRVRDVALSAFEHDSLPFDKLVAELKIARSPSFSPVFQVMFLLEGWPEKPPQFSDLSARVMEYGHNVSPLDLFFGLVEDERGARWECRYVTALFDEATARQFLENWVCLIEAAVANPDARLSALPMMREPVRRRLLVDWNETKADYPRELCIHQLFEAQVGRCPDAVAISFHNQNLTYQQLNERANQLARELRDHGVGPDVLVALCLERSLDMVVGVLGILKSGGAYVPIDPSYPSARTQFMLKDSQAAVLLTQAALAADLTGSSARTIRIDADRSDLARQSADNLESVMTPENLAYVIYTSGSTGNPKGVQVPHRAVVNFLDSVRRRPGFRADDVLLAVTTLSFDIAGLELHLPLTTGGTVVIASRETGADGGQLIAAISQSRATCMQATPATWRLLIAAGWKGNSRLKILCGGEPLQRPLADELLKRCGCLWNMYGPTETTIWSTLDEIRADGAPILIGQPIANTQIYIVDKRLEPVPVGVPGELLIGGDGLARGYRNRPELTAEKFIKHPFSNDADARVYRTGDLARYRPDGRIECLGRLDFQVKIRGYRIELGEIETALGSHPAVREVVVIASDDGSGEKSLIAYFSTRDGGEISATKLRAHLKDKLPDNMVPSVFVRLERLPLTANGKVDRRALPAPTEADRRDHREYVAPTTPVEIILAEIWSRALEIERVGLMDNFFALGGHSLLAVQIVARIRDELQVDLPVRAIFDATDLSALSAGVEAALMKNQNLDDIEAILAELDD